MTSKVLFVDDDPNILAGYQRTLRRQFQIETVDSGQAALDLIDGGKSYAVIVSDMRMPGMDGATLLAEVKERYPSTARLMLSGHAEREAILRALPVVHRFMVKPCDTNELRAAIDRACDLQGVLSSDVLRKTVGGLEALPSPPRTYFALTAAAANPNSNLSEVAEIVQSDPAMSTRLLQLVNSAYFGAPEDVVSIAQAVTYLGLELVRCLALTTHVFAMTETRPTAGLSVDALYAEAFAVARLTQRFLGDDSRHDAAFTAALVHDIGKVILAVNRPDTVASILDLAQNDPRPLHELEMEAFGVSHAEVGAYLLGVWGLPFSLVEIAAYHHRPSAVSGGDLSLLAAVHAADALGTRGADAPLDVEFLERAGFADRVERWRDIARKAKP